MIGLTSEITDEISFALSLSEGPGIKNAKCLGSERGIVVISWWCHFPRVTIFLMLLQKGAFTIRMDCSDETEINSRGTLGCALRPCRSDSNAPVSLKVTAKTPPLIYHCRQMVPNEVKPPSSVLNCRITQDGSKLNGALSHVSVLQSFTDW